MLPRTLTMAWHPEGIRWRARDRSSSTPTPEWTTRWPCSWPGARRRSPWPPSPRWPATCASRPATANAARLVALCRPSPVPVVAAGAAAPSGPAARHRHPLSRGRRAGRRRRAGPRPGGACAVEPAARPTSCEAARRRGRDLTLIALGPLTNVALRPRADAAALRTDRPAGDHGGRRRRPRQRHPDGGVQHARRSRGGRRRVRRGPADRPRAARRDAPGRPPARRPRGGAGGGARRR